MQRPASRKSRNSMHTHTSRSSSKLTAALIEQTVTVERARTDIRYAEEEAELLKQEAALKASRNLLTAKKELETVENGLDAVKMVLDFNEESDFDNDNFLTTRYVNENVGVDRPPPIQSMDNDHVSPVPVLASSHRLDPDTTPFQPNEAVQLAKVVVQNQLIPQRLWKFDGEPSRYLTWKHSFQSVMSDLSVNSFMNLDLLINNLGPACKVQCDNIRSTNAKPLRKYGND
ncbi:hypothetical protein FSP39_020813 [Pinctada imbricata]|uniref:Uncharacterized protein n=1 Tax=Pinctada imbricata TaxID=66713 RepID=A0AA89C9D7_PINIB|nr:hypothetical protein FSP39_020813 [Pinctada imbricata]